MSRQPALKPVVSDPVHSTQVRQGASSAQTAPEGNEPKGIGRGSRQKLGLESAASHSPLETAPAAAYSQPDRADSTPSRRHSPLALRVLTGVQHGAQARMRHHRLLVGNLESECDVLLDVGRPQPHACLVRASKDGWTVLSIAGDLWVGEAWLALQQTREIFSGDVLTLGEVSFCVADTTTVDWTRVRVPAQRQASGAGVTGRAASRGEPAVLSASGPRLGRWREQFKFIKFTRGGAFVKEPGTSSAAASRAASKQQAKGRAFIGGLLSVGLMLGVVGIYLVSTASLSPASARKSQNVREATRAVLAGLPWAGELTAETDPFRARRVLVGGYLPERQRLAALDAVLRQQDIEPEHHWTAVDELTLDLSRRLGLPDAPAAPVPAPLRYSGQGRFVVMDTSSNMQKVDRLIRRVLQDMPAVRAIDLELSDQTNAEASERISGGSHTAGPVVIHYARTDGAPGNVSVTGLEQLQPVQKLQRYEVRELRLGRLPSVVLEDGARYFEGSNLPGGALLVQVQPSHLLVQAGNETRSVDIDAKVQVAAKSSARRGMSAATEVTSDTEEVSDPP